MASGRPAPLQGPTTSRSLEQDEFANLTYLMDQPYTPVSNIDEIISNLLGNHRDEEKARLQALRGEEACRIMFSLQIWIDENPNHTMKWRIVRVLTRIATDSTLFPPSLFLTNVQNVSPDRLKRGGFADVYMGLHNDKPVALKRLLINDGGRERNRIHRAFCKESLLWRQLTHPNVLPFIGIDGRSFGRAYDLAMVSPWLQRGTMKDYILSDAYDSHAHQQSLIRDVANGLNYLHERPIAHGDFHWCNVLISDDGQALLTDFGLTVVAETSRSQTMSTSNPTGGGAIRWMAPELFSVEPELSRKSIPADVYAFGRLCLAVCTAREPLYQLTERALLGVLVAGVFPGPIATRPTDEECEGFPMSDQLWELAETCCAYGPQDRPSMSHILTQV